MSAYLHFPTVEESRGLRVAADEPLPQLGLRRWSWRAWLLGRLGVRRITVRHGDRVVERHHFTTSTPRRRAQKERT